MTSESLQCPPSERSEQRKDPIAAVVLRRFPWDLPEIHAANLSNPGLSDSDLHPTGIRPARIGSGRLLVLSESPPSPVQPNPANSRPRTPGNPTSQPKQTARPASTSRWRCAI